MTVNAKNTKSTKGKEPSFSWNAENARRAAAIVKKYPKGRAQSALLPLLDLAQRQNDNWLSRAAMDYIADYLGIPAIRVYEVATFYTMFNLKPVGKNLVQVCQTSPCWLRGSDALEKVCEKHIGAEKTVTKDGLFSWMKVECLGACVNAPMVQINDDYYEDLDPKALTQILQTLGKGKKVPAGSQKGRSGSEPSGGLTTLTSLKKGKS